MGLVFLVVLGFLAGVWGEDQGHGLLVEPDNNVAESDELASTEVVLAFVIFRHGDRTPDQEELELYPSDKKYENVFFPYGMKALTNKGKQRGYLVGEYLKHRYAGLISRLYLPDEISVRTTNYDRTKMTALAALAAMYPPMPAQKWNPMLNWQPIPYNTFDADTDDLLYWYNCPRYLWLRDQMYNDPEFVRLMEPYQTLLPYLSEKTGKNYTTSENVFFLDNVLQAMDNVGIKPPKWAQEIMPKIRQVTKIEYAAEFYTAELTKLASGVLMEEILNATAAEIAGDKEQPRLRLYSAHENNVAALMSAARVFQAHQPNYGATFSLELRKNSATGKYGFTAVYAPTAGGVAEILPVQGCGGHLLCDYETFVDLMQDIVWTKEEFRKQCPHRA